jgi:hypothetical protein
MDSVSEGKLFNLEALISEAFSCIIWIVTMFVQFYLHLWK